MDLDELIKQERKCFDNEDSNENYLSLDYEIGIKVEGESVSIEDWCLENSENYHDTIDYTDVKEEYEIIGDIKQFHTCLICQRLFDDSYSLYEHNLIHLKVVLQKEIHLYQCEYCLCYYTIKRNLIQHIQIKHFMMIKSQNFPISKSMQDCKICKKTFTYSHWHSHMRDVHSTEKMQCKLCRQLFKCWTYLRRHLLYVHGDVKPSWRSHKVSVDIDLKCNLCPSVFSNRNSLTTHMRNCHSSQVHKCTLCNSTLKTRSYLLTHMRRVHYNDGKLYECSICSKVFKSARYLNIHKKNSHYVKVKILKPMSMPNK